MNASTSSRMGMDGTAPMRVTVIPLAYVATVIARPTIAGVKAAWAPILSGDSPCALASSATKNPTHVSPAA
ncbi:hypothetical protein GGI18_005545, partial [Coemansia linderi]